MCKKHLPKNVTRRDILRYTMAAAGIAALGPLGRGLMREASGTPLTNHRRLVSLFGYGGYDGLNLLVPVTNQAYHDRRPGIRIDPGNALDIGETDYALHPSMTNLQTLFNAGEAAAFRMVGYPDANLSHFISQDIHSWGVRGEFNPLGMDESGWVARYADLHAPTSMGAAAIGVGRPLEFEGGSSNPFMAGSLNGFDFTTSNIGSTDHAHRLNALADVLGNFSGNALTTEAKNALDQGVQLTDQIQLAVDNYEADPMSSGGSSFSGVYGNDRPARYLRDAAILIHGGFETRVFMTGFGGWDTHGNQGAETGTQATLIQRLDHAIGTFADDCKEMGVWNDMLILVSSEFGRRNFENGSGGTDHGHGNIFFAIGGNLQPGTKLYGPEITEADIADQNWLHYELDYRDVFREAISNHLGGNGALVFPESQDINTSLGYV